LADTTIEDVHLASSSSYLLTGSTAVPSGCTVGEFYYDTTTRLITFCGTVGVSGVGQLRLTERTTAQEGTMTLVEGDVWYNTDLDCIRLRLSGMTNCIANGTNPISVKSFGALGDGITDDTAAIQAAIDAAKVIGSAGIQGTPVSFPCGNYLISSPLILPRTGLTPTNIVHLVGVSLRCARITGGPTFPTNRALVEWEVSATRAWHQSISNLTFKLPSVTGTMAINYKPTLKSTQAEILFELLQIDLEDILVEGDNEFHDTFIYLEGNIKFSTVNRLYCDPGAGGAWNFDTICLKTDTADFSTFDASGFHSSSLTNIYSSIRRGGFSQLFQGRLVGSEFDVSFCDGNRNAICYEFINSIDFSFTNWQTEGRGEKPQVKCTNCEYPVFRGFSLGTPNDAGSGVGNGLELVNTTDGTFQDRLSRVGTPAFSASAVKLITADANSTHNRFLNIGVIGAFSTEITDSGSDNYWEGHRQDGSPALQSLGTLRRGPFSATEYRAPSSTAHSDFYDDTGSNLRLRIRRDKSGIEFGPNQEAALDWVGSGAILRLPNSPNTSLQKRASATTDVGFHSVVTGDTSNRWQITAGGKQSWGPGDSAVDTNLYRSAADTLKTDDAFVVAVGNPLEGSLSNQPRWIFKQVDHTDLVAAATADDFVLWTLPANTMIHDVVGTVVVAWAGTGPVSAAVCSVGTAAGSANDLTLDDNFFSAATVYELHDATASGGKGALLFDTTDKFAPFMLVASGDIEIQCDLTGGDHADTSAGQARIYILVSQPLANTTTEAN
jgi:hypothetical protein